MCHAFRGEQQSHKHSQQTFSQSCMASRTAGKQRCQLEPPPCSLPCRASLSGFRKVLDAAWAAIVEAQMAERRHVGQGGRPARSHDARVAADVQTPTAPTMNMHHQAAPQEGTLHGTTSALRCHDCNINLRHARQLTLRTSKGFTWKRANRILRIGELYDHATIERPRKQI